MSTADRIKPTDAAVATFLDNLRGKRYQIPTFQREVVWEKDNVKKLWDSIYRFYPIGSILVWKTPVRLHRHRTIGGHVISNDEVQDEYQYILDGQQRTTSLLTSLFGGRIEGREDFDPTVYLDLTIPRSEEPEDETYSDRFLFWSEIDDRGRVPHQNNERKRKFDEGYVVRLRDIAFAFGKVEKGLVEDHPDYDDPVRIRLREMKQVLDTYRVAFIELKGIQIAEVCQIFVRVNQAGRPLDIFDIVVAKTYQQPDGDAPAIGRGASTSPGGFYLRDLVEDFRDSIPGSAYATLDDHTLLQAAAAIVRTTVGGTKVKNVTDRYLNELTADELRTVWPGTTDALRKTFDLLENHLSIKGPALVPFRYLYLALASYFFENESPDLEFLKRYFWYVSFHTERVLRSTSMLWGEVDLLTRHARGEAAELDPFVVDRARIRRASYSSRGRYSRAILSLFASQEPRDWQHPARKVIADVYYQLTDKPNLHHVFPLGYTRHMEGVQWVDRNSLMNIVYLTQITNLRIRDANPVDYLTSLEGFKAEVGLRQRLIESHLLPGELLEWAEAGSLPPDSLASFIEDRTELVLEDLRRKVGGDRMQVIDSGMGEDDQDD